MINLPPGPSDWPSPADIPADKSLHPGGIDAPSAWHPLTLVDRLALFLMLVIVTRAAVPRLPSGICFSDSGGFQLAAATLGITHPPGYAGFISLWHLLTRIVGGDPAYVVAVACLAAGLGALALLALLQMRLGVNSWIACAVSLALTAHPRVWSNLLAPEIYATSLLFVAASVYLLLRYARRGRSIDLFAAALFYGIAVANRIPAILLLPFILFAWWIARRRWETGWSSGARTLALCTALAALPGLYNLGFLWVRDTPDTPYNYMEQYNADTNVLPASTDGWRAKCRRVIWHHSAEQFRDLLLWHPFADPVRNQWSARVHQVRAKLRWVVQDVFPSPAVSLGLLWVFTCVTAAVAHRRRRILSLALTALSLTAAFLFLWSQVSPALAISPLAFQIIENKSAADLLLIGMGVYAAAVTVQRCRVAGVLLIGVAATTIGYVSIYRIHGLAADLLPLLFAAAIWGGVILSAVFPPRCSRPRAATAALIMVLVGIMTLIRAPQRASLGRHEDAADYLAQVDLPTLPHGAVICSTWGTSTPLWYACLIQTPRPDIHIVNAPITEWDRLTRAHRHQPIYATETIQGTGAWPGTTWRRERNLWRLEQTEK